MEETRNMTNKVSLQDSCKIIELKKRNHKDISKEEVTD